MESFKNQKFLTSFFIAIGLILAGVNFLIYQGVSFDKTGLNIKNALTGAKASELSPVLPDIKRNQSFTESKIRSSEINKIKNSLPLYDNSISLTLTYNERSKILLAKIDASTIEQYRERKAISEAKLVELGADNICNLVALWSPPTDLTSKLTHNDLVTTGCPS